MVGSGEPVQSARGAGRPLPVDSERVRRRFGRDFAAFAESPLHAGRAVVLFAAGTDAAFVGWRPRSLVRISSKRSAVAMENDAEH